METSSPFRVDFKQEQVQEEQTAAPKVPTNPRVKSHSKNTSLIIMIIFIIVITALSGGLFWTYRQYLQSKREVEELKDPGKYAEKMDQEAQAIVDKLALLMVLPTDEKPTVATVVDVDALRKENPTFYKDAKNGDRLIIYSTKAILFRAEDNKIINVAPVQITPNSSTTVSLTVEVLNGTETGGNGSLMEQAIGALGSTYSIAGVGDAKSKDYQKTTVYDLTNGAKADLVRNLATSLNAEYQAGLPDGETSASEVLVVVGSDFSG